MSKLFALLLTLFAVASGCSSKEVKVRVSSDPKTNGGLPFYVVCRSVEGGTFVTESPEIVSKKVFASPKDPSVLRAEVIYPGVDKEVRFDKPQALPLAIYFLFTKPGEHWKTSRDQPVPSSVDIELSGNQIKREG